MSAKRDFSVTIDIAAPPDRVWRIMSDVERWHEWTASIAGVTLLDPGPLRPGVRALVRQPKLPQARWQVTEADPRTGFIWVSRHPGVHVTGRHMIEPSALGTRVTLGVHYGGALGWLVARQFKEITARYIQLEAEGLKRRSEDPSTS